MDAFQLHSGIPSLGPQEPEDVYIFFSLMEDALQRYNPQQLLDSAEEERFNKYRTEGKRNEFLFGRMFMKKLLGEILALPAAEVSLGINEHRRPYLPGQKLQFNLSHSFGGFALIVSSQLPVGVDIEYRKRNISLEDANHVFMPAEKISMAKKEDEAAKNEFLHRWTAKEAIYKAADVGTQLLFNEFELSFDPLQLHSHSSHLPEEAWELRHAYPHPDYLLAFAVQNPAATPLNFYFHQILF
ncbi:MAG: 4'-phosphopantetheinyl transferase superfamily protein [Bacteroidota bacterium]